MSLERNWPAALQNDDVRFLADAIPGPLSYLDQELRYRFVNAMYEELLPNSGSEVSTQEIIGLNIEEAWGELAAIIRPNLERALAGERLTIEVDFGGSRSLNSYIPHVVDGEVRGVLLIAQDITELSASRAALVQAERMASLGRVVAGLLHELNTPLGVLASTVDTMQRGLQKLAAEADPARRERLLGQLTQIGEASAQAVTRMSEMSGRLRSFARVEEAPVQEADLREGLETTLAILESERPEGVEVAREFAHLPPLRCRPADINQVFMTLLSNALAAVGTSGRVTIRASADDSHVQVCVADSGVGIEPERLTRIFEPSFGVDGSRVQAGMSLFVSRNIAKQHGGTLTVDSGPGRGAAFTLRLPRDGPAL